MYDPLVAMMGSDAPPPHCKAGSSSEGCSCHCGAGSSMSSGGTALASSSNGSSSFLSHRHFASPAKRCSLQLPSASGSGSTLCSTSYSSSSTADNNNSSGSKHHSSRSAARHLRTAACAATFVVSGLEHELYHWLVLGAPSPGWRWLLFFSVQPLVLLAARALAARVPPLQRLWRPVQSLAVLLALGVTSELLFWWVGWVPGWMGGWVCRGSRGRVCVHACSRECARGGAMPRCAAVAPPFLLAAQGCGGRLHWGAHACMALNIGACRHARDIGCRIEGTYSGVCHAADPSLQYVQSPAGAHSLILTLPMLCGLHGRRPVMTQAAVCERLAGCWIGAAARWVAAWVPKPAWGLACAWPAPLAD